MTRTTITPPEGARLTVDGNDRDLAITPDGTRVVYAGANATQLFVRALDALDPAPLVALGGGGAQGIFTSPDGEWVGYVEGNNSLKKVAITGGPAVALLEMEGFSRGATWTVDETIIFATNRPETGLQSLSAAGGSPTVLTRPNRERGEADHLWPEVLPDGRHVLFTITAVRGGLDAAQVAVLDRETGTYKTLVRGGAHAHYVASGHLVYGVAGTLRAVAFDLDRLEARGTPVPVLPRLVTTQVGGADFSVADGGTLVYVDAPGAAGINQRSLVWVDRKGVETPVGAPLRPYLTPRLSPDGNRVAFFIATNQETDIWISDLMRGTLTRLTFEDGVDNSPVWTPDGRRLVFSGRGDLYSRAADGTGGAERLTEDDAIQLPTGLSPDGSRVVFDEQIAGTGAPRDVRILPLPPGARSDATTLLGTRFGERNGVISPDGRWLAYEANPSGPYEIYVRPFPNVDDGQWQVSTGGGRQPLWDRTGRELFYIARDGALNTVPVEGRAGTWSAGKPARLFVAGSLYADIGLVGRQYDVSPDGQRFLMMKQGSETNATPPQIVVVQNWLEELKRLVPVP